MLFVMTPSGDPETIGLLARFRRRLQREDLSAPERNRYRTRWNLEAVERSLGEQLGESAEDMDLIMAAIASYRRVGRNLPPGVRVHYDGTVYAPPELTDVEELMDRAFDDELLLRTGELRGAATKTGSGPGD
jgi:hypothetical protein